MDSHGANVAMSRHRDGMILHHGRDDFAHQSKLVRTLSCERIEEIARQRPERAKPSFAGFCCNLAAAGSMHRQDSCGATAKGQIMGSAKLS